MRFSIVNAAALVAAILAALLGVNGYISHWHGEITRQSHAQVARVTSVVDALQDLTAAVDEAEGAVHSYLLTREAASLRPYALAVERIPRLAAELRATAIGDGAGNGANGAGIGRLIATVDVALQGFAAVLAEARAGAFDQAVATRRLSSADGAVERARAQVDTLREGQQALLSLHLQQSERSERIAGLLDNASTVLAALGIAAAFLMMLVEFRRQRALAAEVERARAASEAAERATQSFLATMGHELRSPLNAVIGFADMLARETLGPVGNPRYREYGAAIRGSGEHLLDMINAILDFSKAEAGQFELSEEVFAIDDVLGESAVIVEGQAERAGLALVRQFVRPPVRVRADRRLVKQVAINLLANAIKYTPVGGQVRIATALEADGRLAIAVADTGIGIAEADLPKVMEAFRQIDNPENRRQRGTGLGLALVKRFVELHGGTVAIASTPGAGTTVTVHLPAARVVADAPAAALPPAEPAALRLDTPR